VQPAARAPSRVRAQPLRFVFIFSPRVDEEPGGEEDGPRPLRIYVRKFPPREKNPRSASRKVASCSPRPRRARSRPPSSIPAKRAEKCGAVFFFSVRTPGPPGGIDLPLASASRPRGESPRRRVKQVGPRPRSLAGEHRPAGLPPCATARPGLAAAQAAGMRPQQELAPRGFRQLHAEPRAAGPARTRPPGLRVLHSQKRPTAPPPLSMPPSASPALPRSLVGAATRPITAPLPTSMDLPWQWAPARLPRRLRRAAAEVPVERPGAHRRAGGRREGRPPFPGRPRPRPQGAGYHACVG